MKYPIGIQNFEDLRRNYYAYVDKTNFVYKLADEGKYYFLSRPRRFGKSLFLSTLEAYFQGKKELFEGLAICDMEKEWKKYPIFHIDLNTANFREKDSLYIEHIEKYLDCADKDDAINYLNTAGKDIPQ